MAELISKESSPKKGRRKHSTRIDLTPMVDLGFILITFFLFTTSLLKPNSIVVQMPDETPTPNPNVVPDHEALKVFIGANHQVFFLSGNSAMKNDFSKLKSISLNDPNELRQSLLSFKEEVAEAVLRKDKGTKPGDEPFIFLKPTSQSNYNDLIQVMDELSINGIQRYVIVDLDEQERKRFES